MVHNVKVEVDGEADCPEDRRLGEVVRKVSLRNAEILHDLVLGLVKHRTAVVSRAEVEAIEVDNVSNQVCHTHPQVHEREMDEDQPCIAAKGLEKCIGKDDQQCSDQREDAGDANGCSERRPLAPEVDGSCRAGHTRWSCTVPAHDQSKHVATLQN